MLYIPLNEMYQAITNGIAHTPPNISLITYNATEFLNLLILYWTAM